MISATSTGRAIGMLLLVQLTCGLIVPYVLLHPVSAPAGAFLETAAPLEGTVRLSVLMLFFGGAASLGIAIAAWPLLRDRQLRLGLCFLTLATINFTLQLIENANWLSLLTMSQHHASANGAGAEMLRPLALAAHASWRWAHYTHILIVVASLFAFYLLLYRGALVPRLLALFAMVAAPLQFIGITLPAFGGYRMPLPDLFGMPLGLATLAIALWLIVKGFADVASADASPSPPARA